MMDESKVGPSDHEELVQMQGMAPAPPKPAKGAKPKKKDLPDPPAVLAPAPPTLLDQVLKKRRHQRLKMTAHNLRKKFMDAKVERQEADAILGRKKAKYLKTKTAEAEARSAKSAASKKQKLYEQEIIGEHEKVAIAKTEFKKARKAFKLAKAMVRGEQVEEQVASAFAQTGGAKRNLKKAEKARQRQNQRLLRVQRELPRPKRQRLQPKQI